MEANLSAADPLDSGPKLLADPPARLHHYAFTVRDQEVNRRFMEEVLGIPLVATWCERVFRPEVGREVDYCHTFFEIADGGAIAFFQWDDKEVSEQNLTPQRKSGGGPHLALKVSRRTQDEIEERVKRAGEPYRITDHGYCRSLYVHTPDGLRLEFTVDPPNADAIAAMRRADAHAELKRWLAGDHRTNNEDRPH
jgi:catechol 2,3-dioxygenase-like lactoylglutathione lyase family enzyme